MPTSFSVALGTPSLKAGDVVVFGGFNGVGQQTVRQADRGPGSGLAAMPTVFGVVHQPTMGEAGKFDVYVAGEIIPAGTGGAGVGLGAGASSIVAVDDVAHLTRVARPDGSEFVVGTCDTSGHTIVQPRASRDTSPHHVYNPKSYGCPWDGVHDDLPGFQAMLAAIIVVPSETAPIVIQLPPGQGYFSDNLELSRTLIIRGEGTGINDAMAAMPNGMRFAPLKGVLLHSYYTQPDAPAGVGADGTRIENTTLVSTLAVVADPVNGCGRNLKMLDTSLDIRSSTPTYYAKGVCVIPIGSAGSGAQDSYNDEGATRGGVKVMFRVTDGGWTLGGPEPPDFAAATVSNIGKLIVDGGVTWTVESIPQDYINNQRYEVGERVFLPGDTAC